MFTKVNSIGTDLRLARQATGLSLREAAKRASLSVGALSLLERDQRYPSLRSLEALARVLGVVFTVSPEGVVVTARPRKSR
jgi:transcriptional regulator with XRE-family HTH domain